MSVPACVKQDGRWNADLPSAVTSKSVSIAAGEQVLRTTQTLSTETQGQCGCNSKDTSRAPV